MVRVGVIGYGYWGPNLVRNFVETPDMQLIAVADLRQDRLDLVQRRYPGVEVTKDCREIINHPHIDAIAISTPVSTHFPLAMEALRAGKHVLVEKPVGLNAREAQSLLDAANRAPHLKVMEAFMYRHHPQWITARELARGGQIGELTTVHSFFSYYDVDPTNVRNDGAIGGGGGLMDIGCYPISLSRFIFDREPVRVVGTATFDPVFKVDVLASGIMDFGVGSATFTCSTQLVPFQRVHIYGTEGYVEIEIPFNAPTTSAHRLWHKHGRELTTIEVGGHDQYTIQGDLMSRAILDDTPVPTPLGDAVANMQVIDNLFRSAATNSWV